MSPVEIDLSGRVALVTGAGRGIGKAIAIALAESGADIALNDLDTASIKKTSSEIDTLGRKAPVFQADVSRKMDVEEAAKRAERELGKIDILVNSAGVIVRKPAEDHSEQDWDRVLTINLKGVFNFSHAVCKSMIAQRFGRIINIASIMAEVAQEVLARKNSDE